MALLALSSPIVALVFYFNFHLSVFLLQQGFDVVEQKGEPNQISSFGEAKSVKFATKHAQEYSKPYIYIRKMKKKGSKNNNNNNKNKNKKKKNEIEKKKRVDLMY